MSGRSFGILLAAGLGKRLGAGKPKAFVKVGSKTILEQSLSTMLSCNIFDLVVVAVPVDSVESLSAEYGECKNVAFVEGGAQRADSVRCALNFLVGQESTRDEDVVAVHDAARCFVTPELISNVVIAARLHGAVTAAIPSTDSIKLVRNDGVVERSLDRDATWIVQTPQAFHVPILCRAHAVGDSSATDDASLVEKFHEVRVIMGDPENIKVTFSHDIPSWQN